MLSRPRDRRCNRRCVFALSLREWPHAGRRRLPRKAVRPHPTVALSQSDSTGPGQAVRARTCGIELAKTIRCGFRSCLCPRGGYEVFPESFH